MGEDECTKIVWPCEENVGGQNDKDSVEYQSNTVGSWGSVQLPLA